MEWGRDFGSQEAPSTKEALQVPGPQGAVGGTRGHLPSSCGLSAPPGLLLNPGPEAAQRPGRRPRQFLGLEKKEKGRGLAFHKAPVTVGSFQTVARKPSQKARAGAHPEQARRDLGHARPPGPHPGSRRLPVHLHKGPLAPSPVPAGVQGTKKAATGLGFRGPPLTRGDEPQSPRGPTCWPWQAPSKPEARAAPGPGDFQHRPHGSPGTECSACPRGCQLDGRSPVAQLPFKPGRLKRNRKRQRTGASCPAIQLSGWGEVLTPPPPPTPPHAPAHPAPPPPRPPPAPPLLFGAVQQDAREAPIAAAQGDHERVHIHDLLHPHRQPAAHPQLRGARLHAGVPGAPGASRAGSARLERGPAR
ncbi:basic proline-rich protein-like [Vombatus ursinus]|uniref:basic proline-rich protein-like n=1 Tax=Vombatus ursinus TaxID=29139 RepID=UPI000FFD3B00|nr:basic proline-rich protein-like [Vombatus ursinus]